MGEGIGAGMGASMGAGICECIRAHIYGRTCLDGYLTKKLGIFPLLYVHIGDYSTTFEVF